MANRKKWESRTRLYGIWQSMRGRCGVKKGADERTLSLYAKRGISVCSEWVNSFETFKAWALANDYEDDLEIDRIDNDKGYEPSNCRWVSRKENVNNRRKTLRMSDGTSLAQFCGNYGFPMRDKGVVSSEYAKIAWNFKRGYVHPDLVNFFCSIGRFDELKSKCEGMRWNEVAPYSAKRQYITFPDGVRLVDFCRGMDIQTYRVVLRAFQDGRICRKLQDFAKENGKFDYLERVCTGYLFNYPNF